MCQKCIDREAKNQKPLKVIGQGTKEEQAAFLHASMLDQAAKVVITKAFETARELQNEAHELRSETWVKIGERMNRDPQTQPMVFSPVTGEIEVEIEPETAESTETPAETEKAE